MSQSPACNRKFVGGKAIQPKKWAAKTAAAQLESVEDADSQARRVPTAANQLAVPPRPRRAARRRERAEAEEGVEIGCSHIEEASCFPSSPAGKGMGD